MHLLVPHPAQPFLKLAIKPQVLAALLANGHLHAADFRCLDNGSRQTVWRMLLALAGVNLLDKLASLPRPGNREAGVHD